MVKAEPASFCYEITYYIYEYICSLGSEDEACRPSFIICSYVGSFPSAFFLLGSPRVMCVADARSSHFHSSCFKHDLH